MLAAASATPSVIPAAESLPGLLAALGLGLLIGAVRERRKRSGQVVVVAGLRTHALVAVLGAVAAGFGTATLAVTVIVIGLFAALGYRYTAASDPGLTGEVALVLTVLLGALAARQPALAAGIGVVAAILLEARQALHRLTRDLLSERELHDGLILLASALVIWPLLPDRPLDPWGSLRPDALWRVVLLVMAAGMLGHVALRTVGARWGLALAGFFSGFVSSTAAVAGFATHARSQPEHARYAVAAALFSNLASLLLMLAVVTSVAPALGRAVLPPLAAAAACLLLGGLLGLARAGAHPASAATDGRAFRLDHAVLLTLAIAAVTVLASAARSGFGQHGALAVAAIAALAEWHAAAAGLAQMHASATLTTESARWGLVLLLAASSLSKSALAWLGGGRRYGAAISLGMLTATAAAALVLLLIGSD